MQDFSNIQNRATFALSISLICFFSSCATILNKKQTSIEIQTNEPSIVILGLDSIRTIDNKASLYLLRSSDTLKLTVQSRKLKKNVAIEAYSSPSFYLNLMYNSGLAMIYEWDKNKRFKYPRTVFLDMKEPGNSYKQYGPANNKGNWYFHFSIPYLNSFHLEPSGEEGGKNNTGFFGFSTGLDYYHSKNQYFSWKGSAATTFLFFIPVPIEQSGEKEESRTIYTSFTNNHKINRWSLGYGLSLSENVWEFRYFDAFDPLPPTRDPTKITSLNFGLEFPIYYQMGDYFHIGLLYRPSFINLTEGQSSKYEHFISLDFAWKLRI